MPRPAESAIRARMRREDRFSISSDTLSQTSAGIGRLDAFQACFTPLMVTQPHDGFANYWHLQLPSHSMRFYAPKTGKLKDSIAFAQFQFEAALGDYAAWAKHPFWTGAFKALVSWPALLKLSMTDLGDAIFVPRPSC